MLNYILPLIEDPQKPSRPPKPAIRSFITDFTIQDFLKRPNPPHTDPPRAPPNTGPKGLLPRKLCHQVSAVRMGHGWFPLYLKRIGLQNGRCKWCNAPEANRQHMISTCPKMPTPLTPAMAALSLEELVYNDDHLPLLLPHITKNGIGLRSTIAAGLTDNP